jgi:hypothetical protein
MLALQLHVSQLTLTTKLIYFVPNSSLWLVEFLWPMLFKCLLVVIFEFSVNFFCIFVSDYL